MPITLPAFAQYQAPLFPLRGLWNIAPPEGDRFVNAEIDWGSPGFAGLSCVQFQLSGNSPVAFSQIVAMSVDNSRCGSDVDFIYPDSGFVLTVPAFNQGVYPVFTNALMFYANAPGTSLGDVTIVQILNSMPPPVAIQPSSEQQTQAVTAVALTTGSTTPIIPAGVSGTLNTLSVIATATAPAGATAVLSLRDGTGAILWQSQITVPDALSINLSNLHIRFTNGVSLVVSATTITAGNVAATLYYSVP